MTTITKKYALSTLVAIIAIASTIVGLLLIEDATAQHPKMVELTLPNLPSGTERFSLAGEPFMVSSPSLNKISVQKGTSASVIVNLTHESGSNPQSKFVVTPEINGFIIPKTVLETTTIHDRATMLANGDIPKGVIPISTWIEFYPKSVILNSGESKQVEMRITIPDNIPPELIGDTINISPSYQISGKSGIERMGVFSFNVDVEIGGQRQ